MFYIFNRKVKNINRADIPIMNDPWKRVKIKKIDGKERVKNFLPYVTPYTKEEAMAEAERCLHCPTVPCIKACPANVKARFYVEAIEKGDFDEALKIVREDLPLSAVCANACPAFCEDACPRGKRGDSLAIRWLKRAAEDYGEVEEKAEQIENPARIAVIGAGPAGLSVAYFLALKGHKVDIFEALDYAGGMVYVGIPRYRVPMDVLKKDVERIEKLGVNFYYNTEVDEKMLQELKEKYDAVFIGIGAHRARKANCEGEDLDGVIQAIHFLRKVALGEEVKIGKRVAVIGGGDVAMDASRTALRLGAEKVMVLYRRSREEMPATQEEYEDAKEEGVEFHFLTMPFRIIGKECVEAIECLKAKLGEPDASGRRRPVPIEGSNFTIEVDNVILAIGQEPKSSWLEGFEKTKWGTLVVDENYMTSKEGIFAGGDVVLGPKTIVEAVATAKKAAEGILKYIENKRK